jgi:hypothetical protein
VAAVHDVNHYLASLCCSHKVLKWNLAGNRILFRTVDMRPDDHTLVRAAHRLLRYYWYPYVVQLTLAGPFSANVI